MLYTILLIALCLVFWLVGYLLYTSTWLTKRPNLNDENDDSLIRNPLIHSASVGWQELLSHVRLEELLSLQGKTLSGEDFQIIVSLGIGTKLNLIYLRVGSIIHRVPAGQTGLAEVKQGDAFRLIFENHDITLTPLQCPTDAAKPEILIGDHYFSLVLSLTNSLVDGVKISYAARCAKLEGRFIKSWDIPNPQSDESIRSKISSIADLAALAEKVKDLQLANAFIARNNQPIPLDYGVCYLLGKAGGMRLRFVLDGEIAFLIVSDYNPEINLSTFLKSLAIGAQMHAKVMKKNESIMLATQDRHGEYSTISLSQSNVILGVDSPEAKSIPVIRIELDESLGNVLDIYYQNSSSFNNVLVWKNISPPEKS